MNTNVMTKESAINSIIDKLTWGDTVPCVSGGYGGCGYFDYKPKEGFGLGKVRDFLNGYAFKIPAKPADDFADFTNLNDYTDCVEFYDENGSWLQFLLW